MTPALAGAAVGASQFQFLCGEITNPWVIGLYVAIHVVILIGSLYMVAQVLLED